MRLTRMALASVIGIGCLLVASSPAVAVAAPLNGEVDEYVALGDSYVSGPLIMPVQAAAPLGCYRSDHNYPSMVNDALRPQVFRDASCSGATTEDMTTPQNTKLGVNRAQMDRLSTQTDLVTLGIGLNDINFSEIFPTCTRLSVTNLFGAPCRDKYRTSGGDQIDERIESTAPKVAAVLNEITDRAPDARVLLVGYPAIVPDSGPGCYPVLPFTAEDVAWFRGVTKAVNAMLAQEARSADVEYVDIYRRSIGHDVCASTGTKWVEGLAVTSGAGPMHQNALGMRASADAVLDRLRSDPIFGG